MIPVPVTVSRGDSLVDRNVVLGGGACFYNDVCNSYVSVSQEQRFPGSFRWRFIFWAIFRRRTVPWNDIARASILNRRILVDETPSMGFQLETAITEKPTKLWREARYTVQT